MSGRPHPVFDSASFADDDTLLIFANSISQSSCIGTALSGLLSSSSPFFGTHDRTE
jgi:hypothetical protein